MLGNPIQSLVCHIVVFLGAFISWFLSILNNNFILAATGAAAGAWGATYVIIYFDNRKQEKIKFGLINTTIVQLWFDKKMLLQAQKIMSDICQELNDANTQYRGFLTQTQKTSSPKKLQVHTALNRIPKYNFQKGIAISELQSLFCNNPKYLKRITLYPSLIADLLDAVERRNRQVEILLAYSDDLHFKEKILGLPYEINGAICQDTLLISQTENLQKLVDFSLNLVTDILEDIENFGIEFLSKKDAGNMLNSEILNTPN